MTPENSTRERRQLRQLMRNPTDVKRWRAVEIRERDDKTVVDAPVRSFLPPAATGWIEFVNKERTWITYARESDVHNDITVHIANLLNRYLDAMSMTGQQERLSSLQSIAQELTKRMVSDAGKPFAILFANVTYSPDITGDSLEDRPFLLGTGGGVSGVYATLSAFLSSEYSQRLKRCGYCSGLFIAPDGYPYEYCPKTDHRAAYWRDAPAYFSDKMAESRLRKDSKGGRP